MADARESPFASPIPDAIIARTRNQTSGGVPAAERTVNRAMPVIEPRMSNEYARRGGIEVSSGPSGTAKPAMMTMVRMTMSGRTMKLVSARVLSLRPKKISSGELRWIAT